MSKRYSSPEKTVVKECLEYLRLMGIYAWRNNTGAVKIDGNRFLNFGLPGSSDITGILKGGIFIAVECKSDKGKLSEQQKIFMAKIKEQGGLAVLAHSFKDVEKALIENKYF
ncbi:MAG: VRR-NUC domain-containing protein [Spirochaetes bacterium]|nr:VRR-NUC domain-containing protein [Spirochaetota bacterium]